MNQEESQPHRRSGKYLLLLCLAALGVVYGDIGTSPLYAVRECFIGAHAVPVTPTNVLGVLSLIFWSLLIVISIKYLMFVMRADNRGEGGIMALMALIQPERRRTRNLLLALALFGAALLYGDGIITPAITVLSAVEGLEVITPFFAPYVVLVTCVILVALFALQRKGTGGIGALFGPVTLIWFFVIAALGVHQIIRSPYVWHAISPTYAYEFFARNGWQGFLTLGSVFLVVTGGEALYADMGHFGRFPIRINWFVLVLPALLLNYFGQGALLLRNANVVDHLFFAMTPRWGLYPLVILATVAASIASQAVISGSFSLTRQAVLLGYSPRFRVDHTSEREIGQIYVPAVNWTLMLATLALVFGFQSSTHLAAAYGVAVTATMVITTLLLYVVQRELWGWSRLTAGLVTLLFLSLDLAFFAANIVKITHGGWFPLVVASVVFLLMTTWRRGRELLNKRLQEESLPIEVFLKSMAIKPPHRVPGTAVFMNRNADIVPTTLLHSLKHYKVMHERVVLLSVNIEEIPVVDEVKRIQVEQLAPSIYRIRLRYGFMEDPDVPRELSRVNEQGLSFPPLETTYFLGRETVVPKKRSDMPVWREKIFASMMVNSTSAAFFFRLPPNRVVELGAQIEL